MDLGCADIQRQLLREAVVLTGAPRSGTTLLGKILSSFGGLEYHFEPPTLYMIAASRAAGQLSLEAAVNLLTVYLAEDLLLESIHGRNANLRPNDDSQVLNRMSWAGLNRRWNEVANRDDAIRLATERHLRLAVKMPYLFDSLELLQAALAEPTLLVSVRDGRDVVRSVIRKGWLTDAGLRRDLWPYRGQADGVNIPYWVGDAYRDRWAALSEAGRACLMWTHHAELCLDRLGSENRPGLHFVRYEDLLADPWTAVNAMAEAIGCETTPFTRRWVESIRVPASMRAAGRGDLDARVDADILARFERVNGLLGY